MRSASGSPRTGWLVATGRRLRAGTRHGGWWSLIVLVPMAVCLGGAIHLLWLGIDGVRASYGGVAGAVTVEDCRWESGRSGGWLCSGSFRSDDGTVQIDQITVNPWLDEWPQEPVPARVSGASASYARAEVRPYQWVQHLLAGTALFGVAGWLGRSLLAAPDRGARRRSAGAGMAAARPGLAGEGTAATRPVAVLPIPLPPPQPVQLVSGGTAGGIGRSFPVRVVAGYLVLLAATAGFTWSLAAWNRAQDALLSAEVPAEVVGTHLGRDDRIEVAWTDHTGVDWLSRFTPRDPDHLSVGDVIQVRFNPSAEEPGVVYPVEVDAYELPPRDRNMWSAMLLLPGMLLAVTWTVRLGRWGLGTAGRRLQIIVDILAATPRFAYRTEPEPAAFWLRLRRGDGSIRYQRALWSRRLAAMAISAADGVPATARRCPGLRRMYVVDLPGVGRVWPTSTARARPPSFYELHRLSPGRRGLVQRPVRNLVLGGLGLVMLAGLALPLVGGYGLGYLAVLVVAAWLWWGATPWRGIRG